MVMGQMFNASSNTDAMKAIPWVKSLLQEKTINLVRICIPYECQHPPDNGKYCDFLQRGNHIGDTGAASLAEALKHMPGLQKLVLVRIC